MSAQVLAQHQELVLLAEAACAHAQAERWEELAATQDALGEQLAALRGNHPRESEPALRRVRSLNDQVAGVLATRRAGVLAELSGVRATRTAAAGYRPAAGDVDRPMVDQAA